MKKIACLLAFVYSTAGFAQSAAELVQVKLNALRSMTANFSQVVKAKKKEVSHSSGTMALKRPGLFLWKTKSPMDQLVLADGKKMWIYDALLEQVTVKPQQKGLGGTAALFLSGYDNRVAQDFSVQQGTEDGLPVFHLEAKSSKANFQRISLVFKQDKLTQMTLHDQLGQTTVVTFSHIMSNPVLAASVFQFKPPKGVDVIEE